MSAIKGIDGKDYYPSTPAPGKIEKKDSALSEASNKDSFLKSSPPLSPSIYRLITSQIRRTDSDIAPATAPSTEVAEAKEKTGEPQRCLNIFWNQHQPYYKDEASDSFTQPWVRLHAAKDYYDMAAVLENYPNVHVTINLSASLLRQLDEYADKLHDFAGIESPHRGDLKYYPEGHTDRYLDLLLKPVEKWDKDDKEFALNNFFNADYNAQIKPFDGYRYLYEKRNKGLPFTGQDYKDLKVWFNLAWFDHTFQSGDVKLIGDKIDGTPMEPPESVTSIDDLMKKGGTAGYGNANFSEEDAKNTALEQYKIMKYVVPVHRHMQNKISPDGSPQVEVVTTPFYHPILPLIYDSSEAKEANPGMPLPAEALKAPEDAYAQVAKGAEYYKKEFGHYPKGMWPGEGAVSEDVIASFQKNGIKWIATGDEVALRSGHVGDNGLMYRIDTDKTFIDKDGPGGKTDNTDAMSIVFRSMHDRIGFDYGAVNGKMDGADAAADFINKAKSWQHWHGVPMTEDVLVTNMADGENCWTNYANDGNDFLNALYSMLNDPAAGIKTTTPSIFMEDHPIDLQWELEPLAAGTWVGGDFSTWIGEPSENDGWNRLKLTRDALVGAGVPQPDPHKEPPDPAVDRKGYFEWKAWESLYAAEGSDWFWWYGTDQGDQGPSDAKFSETQRTHLVNAFVFAQKAGYDMAYPASQRTPLDASKMTIEVPPITRDPIVDRAVTPDGKTEANLSVKAFIHKDDNRKVSKVTVDLTPLGGKKNVPMTLTKEGIYIVKVKAMPGTSGGKKLLKIEAVSDKGAKSFDFVTVDVTPAPGLPEGRYIIR